MVKITLPLILFFFFLVSPVLGQNYDQIAINIKKFDEVLLELEKFAKSKGIRLNEEENIKDVLSFGYMQSFRRNRKQFPDNSFLEYSSLKNEIKNNVKDETVNFLSFFCWFPFISHNKPEEEEELKKLRYFLTENYYKQILFYYIISIDFQQRQRVDLSGLFNQLLKKQITFGDLINKNAIQEFILKGIK